MHNYMCSHLETHLQISVLHIHVRSRCLCVGIHMFKYQDMTLAELSSEELSSPFGLELEEEELSSAGLSEPLGLDEALSSLLGGFATPRPRPRPPPRLTPRPPRPRAFFEAGAPMVPVPPSDS